MRAINREVGLEDVVRGTSVSQGYDEKWNSNEKAVETRDSDSDKPSH